MKHIVISVRFFSYWPHAAVIRASFHRGSSFWRQVRNEMQWDRKLVGWLQGSELSSPSFWATISSGQSDSWNVSGMIELVGGGARNSKHTAVTKHPSLFRLGFSTPCRKERSLVETLTSTLQTWQRPLESKAWNKPLKCICLQLLWTSRSTTIHALPRGASFVLIWSRYRCQRRFVQKDTAGVTAVRSFDLHAHRIAKTVTIAWLVEILKSHAPHERHIDFQKKRTIYDYNRLYMHASYMHIV